MTLPDTVTKRWNAAILLLVVTVWSGCVSERPHRVETGEKGEGTEIDTKDVWLDVDVSTGLPDSEVDDGLAMIQAFHSPELRVRGVSAIFGNTTLDRAVPIARSIVAAFGPPDLDVASGARSAADLGTETEATRAIAAALEEAPLTLLALGPVTTIASVIQLHPELVHRIEAIVIVAARRPGQRFVTGGTNAEPHPDLNFENDPEAMAILLDSYVELVFAPWEVSSQVELDREDLEALARSSKSGVWVAKNSRSWLAFWKRKWNVSFFNPFDTLAVGWVSRPDLIETIEVGVWIEEGPNDRGSGKKPYLLADPNHRSIRPAIYCYRPLPEFKSHLLDRLSGGN